MKLNLTEVRSYDLILVDAMNLATRCYYGIRLSDNNGPTGMLFGVIRFVLSMQRDYPSATIRFLWEGNVSRRKAKYSSYKKSRQRKEDEFSSCLQELKDVLPHAGVEQAYHIGLEADDLAGWFSKIATSYDEQVLLVSNDSDWLQFVVPTVDIMVKDRIKLYEIVCEELGYLPERVGLYKVLKGDRTDEVSGVPRFPTELALQMVKSCASIDDFLAFDFPQKYARWKDVLASHWSTVVRNEDLVKYHEDWIRPYDIVTVEAAPNMDLLRKVLVCRQMKTLVKWLDSTIV